MLRRRKDDVWDGTERRAPAVVLVVNDDPDACEMLVRMIERQGLPGHRGHQPPTTPPVGSSTDLPRCIVLDLEAGGIGTNLKVLDLIRSHNDKRVSSARVVLCAATAEEPFVLVPVGSRQRRRPAVPHRRPRGADRRRARPAGRGAIPSPP